MAHTMKHEGIGCTPFEATFGRQANLPSILSTTPTVRYKELLDSRKKRHEDYLRKVKERLQTQKEKYKKLQDSQIIIPQSPFNFGNLVSVINNDKKHKLDQERLGTATITEIRHNNNYIILLNNHRFEVYANQLMPYYQ